MRTVIVFGATDTGLAIGDLTWDVCKLVSNGADVATAGSTLVELGGGAYTLNNPNATADTYFSLHITASPTKTAEGTFSETTPTLPIGSGADAVTLTINDAGNNPVADAEVWITSDADGDTVVAGTLRTADDGTATFMLADGETYYAWRRKAGVNFTNPATFIAVAD